MIRLKKRIRYKKWPKKFASKTLKDFVGGNSWVFFARHGNPRPTFLEIPVTQWITNIEYLALQNQVSSMKVTNDAAERAPGLLTEFHTASITKDENQKQLLFQVIRYMRKLNRDTATVLQAESESLRTL